MHGEFSSMCKKINLTVGVALALLPGLFFLPVAGAQSAPGSSLKERLDATYKNGAIFVVQQDGILGISTAEPGITGIPKATYKDGSLHPTSRLVVSGYESRGLLTRSFAIGVKVNVTYISLDLKRDKFTFSISECGSCDGSVEPAAYLSGAYTADVIFQFPKGYLANAELSKVLDEISRVFTIATVTTSVSPSAIAPLEKQEKMTEPPPPLPPPVEPQAPPKTIEVGQTVEQVVAALGQPAKIVKLLGAKELYFYKDLKITFVNGKVSDVE